MARSQILWTILPYGVIDSGAYKNKRRVSVVVSPRLTPESPEEETLMSFEEFVNWPDTVLNGVKFSAIIADKMIPMELISKPDRELWFKLFPKLTFVERFQYMDMGEVNLLSYPVRSILASLKEHYSRLAVESPSDLPQLLPWDRERNALKDMLEDVGTRVEKVDMLPGFDRFFDEDFEQPPFKMKMEVPAPDAEDTELPKMNGMELQVMNPDWKEQEGRFRSAFEYDLYQADRFYRRFRPSKKDFKEGRLNYRRPLYKEVSEEPEEAPELDFHRIIASLSNYPELMRRLGLVLDFVLMESGPLEEPFARDASRPGDGLTRIDNLPIIWTSGRIQLDIARRNRRDSAEDVTPKTAFLSAPGRFITRPRTADHINGLLNLEKADDSYEGSSGSTFDVYQVDPDGSALKTVNSLITEQNLLSRYLNGGRKNRKVTYTTGDQQGSAALRSSGLGVSRHGRAQSVAIDAAAAKRKNELIENGKGNKVTLFAEDVLCGYRVDVAAVKDEHQTPGAWRTLCARQGDYSLVKNGEKLDIAPDEGYVAGPSTTSDINSPKDHYLHESLFRWTGWSLCTPRPGLIIKAEEESGSQVQYEVPTRYEDEDAVDKGCGVRVSFVTKKGTLPRLRYGQLYRFRARIVDLAGNSLALDDPSLDALIGASSAVGYWRFEPIDPPVIVHRTRVSEGESLERMVIRSNYNTSTEGYLTQWPFTVASQYPASQDFAYHARNERHFVPPKSSQQQCETHGLFDQYFKGNWSDIKKSYEIAARDELTLYDKLDGTDIEFVTPSALNGIATTDGAPQLPSEGNPLGDRMAGGQYVVHGEAQITTPWLPDGAAEGVAIRAKAGHKLPGVWREIELGDSCSIKKLPPAFMINNEATFVILVKHKGDWPDRFGFRLILAEVLPPELDFVDEPKWDEAERTLTFFVPKGWVVRLVYSSYGNKYLLEGFGILRWIQDTAKRVQAHQLAYKYGVGWQLMPFRDLTLVHATQAPVFEPEFNAPYEELTLSRTRGSHDVEFYDKTRVRLHGPSTGKFEVEARWSEWVDDPAKDAPELVNFKGQLGEIMLAENHGNNFYLSHAIADHIKTADPEASVTDGRLRGNVHALGDTRFRLIKYQIKATTRFTEYLPPSFATPDENVQEHITRLGPPAIGPHVSLPIVDPDNPDPGAAILRNPAGSNQQSLVLATAPPADPKVLYIVPTMRWERHGSGQRYNVTRFGNGLRVWLDRPWFSSGDGELLGVVIHKNSGNNGSFTEIPAGFDQFVTQWGADPFWESPKSKAQISKEDFPARVRTGTVEAVEELKLQETFDTSDTKVTIIGHRVHFDKEKRLWYCDIELSPQVANYMPFVRLALVRYQPNAMEEINFSAKISKVVLTDFAQVLPNRFVGVEKKDGNINITLSGTNPKSGPLSQDSRYVSGIGVKTGQNRIELVVQRRSSLINSDLAWIEDDEPLFEDLAIDSNPFFKADVPLTGLQLPMTRLVLREFEQFYSDDVLFPNKERVIEERLVFSCDIDI